jgi:hypothetical protein
VIVVADAGPLIYLSVIGRASRRVLVFAACCT